jgi:hypothetical protein
VSAAAVLLGVVLLAAPPPKAEAPAQLTIAFTGDNGGEVAPCG